MTRMSERPTVTTPQLPSAAEPETANASALIYNDRGEYLLHLRDYLPGAIWEPGMWSLLGGGREPQDATLEHTARRELAEEAGLDLVGLTPFGTEYATDDAGKTVPIAPDRLRIADTTSDLVRRHAPQCHPGTAPQSRLAQPDKHRTSPHGTVLNVIGVHLYLERRDGRYCSGCATPTPRWRPRPGTCWPFIRQVVCRIWECRLRARSGPWAGRGTSPGRPEYPKAVEEIVDDEDELLASYDFPAEHWTHLQTTNPMESTSAAVRRQRAKLTKVADSRAAGLAMVFKRVESAQTRWRAVNAPHLDVLDRAGAHSESGHLVEHPETLSA